LLRIIIRSVCLCVCVAVSSVVVTACGGGAPGAAAYAPPYRQPGSGSGSSKIQHVVLIVQENRTFNDLFATFPNAIGTTVGKMRKKGKTVSVNLTEQNLESTKTLDHVYSGYLTAYRNGNMDAFNLIRFQTNGKLEGTQPYQYVNPNQIQPYWTMASSYGLADEMFQTQGSGSFVAHQDLIRGGTAIDSSDSLIDDPTSNAAWGCGSPPGTKTSLITTSLKYLTAQGPFPCTTKFPSSGSYPTLQDVLDAKSVSWKYYTPSAGKGSVGALWNAFLVISAVYNNQNEFKAHISSPETNIFGDITGGTLPAMSWVIPDAQNSDHPGYSSQDTGPSWVASVVNAVGQSPYWNSTAVIVVWDDWGGFYDPVQPPSLDNQGGPGFRVPMIVISPYVPQNEISNTVYEFGSIIRFIEDTFSLGRLGTTDGSSTSMSDMLNFSQSPRQFQNIPSSFSRSYFLRQKPSGLPVDTE
jgi:phospholipase C